VVCPRLAPLPVTELDYISFLPLLKIPSSLGHVVCASCEDWKVGLDSRDGYEDRWWHKEIGPNERKARARGRNNWTLSNVPPLSG
jgi:hypothetical protein